MHKIILLVIDLFLIAAATVFAVVLRDNLEVHPAHLTALLPYIAVTLGVGAACLQILGINRSIWRYAGATDFARLAATSVAIVMVSVVLVFSVNRMEGIARAVPVLQAMLIILLLSGVRMLMRVRHVRRQAQMGMAETRLDRGRGSGAAVQNILVIGVNDLADLYIRAALQFSGGSVRVVGLLGRGDRHTGRLFRQIPILGVPEDVELVLKDLHVHGIAIDRIAVTAPLDTLSLVAREAIEGLASHTDIRVEPLDEKVRFDFGSLLQPARSPKGASLDGEAEFAFAEADLAAIRRRRYWKLKRAMDVVFSGLALVVLAPLIALIAVVVLLDVGYPVTFWQMRPGLNGRPFMLYKFRTMRAAVVKLGEIKPDSDRVSIIGRALRRLRFDELLQLFNILKGDMSFVGPRPLLPRDQSMAHAARLLVRPGLTGWAQVRGGRAVNADDKAALDIWYVSRASLALDCWIVLRTVPMILIGERVSRKAIQRAWAELTSKGVYRPTAVSRIEHATREVAIAG